MKPIHLLLFVVFLITVASCKKKNTFSVTGNYMIIGHNGGFTTINAPYYLLTATSLLKDTTQYSGKIPDDLSKFHFTVIEPAAKFDSVKSLLNGIPPELLNENHANIGNMFPDVGYDDIRASLNGVLYQWTFQADQSTSSTQIQQFISTIRSDL